MTAVISRLAQLLALWVTNRYVAPLLDEKWPDLPDLANETIVGASTFILAELVIFLIIIPPQVIITWLLPTSSHDQKVVDVSREALKRGSASFEMRVTGKSGSPLGKFALWAAIKGGLRVGLSYPVAPLYMTSDLSKPFRQRGKSVEEDASSGGVWLVPEKMPPRNDWIWARVQMKSTDPDTFPTSEVFDLEIEKRTEAWYAPLCAKVVRIKSSAHELRTNP